MGMVCNPKKITLYDDIRKYYRYNLKLWNTFDFPRVNLFCFLHVLGQLLLALKDEYPEILCVHNRPVSQIPRCIGQYPTIHRLVTEICTQYDDVINWKHFPCYWPFVRGIHRWPVNSPHKGQWREALMFSLICAWINGWVNNGEAGGLRCHRAHYDVTVMKCTCLLQNGLMWVNGLVHCGICTTGLFS